MVLTVDCELFVLWGRKTKVTVKIMAMSMMKVPIPIATHAFLFSLEKKSRGFEGDFTEHISLELRGVNAISLFVT